MSKKIPVSYEGQHCYDILIQNDFFQISEALKNLGVSNKSKFCIVTDSCVSGIWLDKLYRDLIDFFPNLIKFEFNAGEESKNLDTVGRLYKFLIENHFDRKDYLIALGGGVVGDLVGFTAATYLRGIPFIQVPTTLLSQVDSSIGGKTGVDYMKYKNMVGAFYQPLLVYMNLSVLSTLGDDDFYSGMGEIIKHGLIADEKYFNWLYEEESNIKNRRLEVLEEMIFQSCLIKRHVVQIDPKEKNERAMLNFGHTIGHAVEKLSNFTMSHGACVAIGTVAACYLSMKQGHISKEQLEKIKHLLNAFSLPTSLKGKNMSSQDILAATKSDKKMEAGRIKFVLIKEIGEAYITKSLDDEALTDAINYVAS